MAYMISIYLLAVVLLAISLGVLVFKWPLGPHATFSQHAAQSHKLSIYYAIIFATTLPVICLFMYAWLTPTYKLSYWIPSLFAGATITQIACTFFPESKSKGQALVHRILAGLSGLLLGLCMILLAVSTTGIQQLICSIAVLGMAMAVAAAITLKGRFFFNRTNMLLLILFCSHHCTDLRMALINRVSLQNMI
jgi:hypothetical protein